MEEFNDFCLFCTGKNTDDIEHCDDINCPFHPFRNGGLEKEVEHDIIEKMLLYTHLKE